MFDLCKRVTNLVGVADHTEAGRQGEENRAFKERLPFFFYI